MLKRLIIAASLLLPTMLWAQVDIEGEFRDRLSLFSDKNKSIECQFEQTKKVKNLKSEVKSRGDFYYDNSGSLALIYVKPQGDKVIMLSDKFVIVSAGKTTISRAADNPMLAQISTMMQGCMSGNLDQFDKGWDLSIEKNGDDYKASLIPTNRRIRRFITAIEMVFDSKDMTLDELRMLEASGGGTTYSFFDKRLNTPINPSVFK